MDTQTHLIQKIKPCDTNSPYIFISYSSADRELVWEDVYEFQRRGYNIWLDEKNLDKTKESWKQDALMAIEDMECMLLVFYVSETSLRSDACYRELSKTIDERTKAMHFGPVKFIAIDVDAVGDITVFTQKVFQSIRNSDVDKEERRKQALALDGFMRQFFNSNNEKVRVHPKNEPNRKMDYYEEILSSFPNETCIAPVELPALEETGTAVDEAVEAGGQKEIIDVAEMEELETEMEAAEPEKPEEVVEAEEPEMEAAEPEKPEEVVGTEELKEPEVEMEAAEMKEPGAAAGTLTDLFTLPAEPEENGIVYGAKKLNRKELLSISDGTGTYRVPEGYTSVEVLFFGNIFQRAGDVAVLELPDSMQKINLQAFSDCEALKEIRLPQHIDCIPAGAFENCSSLTVIEIPGTVKKIDSRAFKNCTSLEKVKLPLYLSELKMNVFEGCTSLQEIHLPSALEKADIGCFEKCISLQEVHIPGSLKKIPGSMFSKCSSLHKVVIEDGVEEIDSSFSYCGESNLHIWIPDTVKKIDGIAFYKTSVIIHCNKDSAAYDYAVKEKISYVLNQ